jgi:Fe-S-cluster-containing dehydrogenase component
MKITRRSLFGNMASGLAVTAVAGTHPSIAAAEAEGIPSTKAVGMLYDASKCVGCQSCVVACREANNVTPDTRFDPLHASPRDLNDETKNIIKIYKSEDGHEYSYIKQQCMHCVDPACVAACMFRALKKEPETGIVTWTPSLCVGCRYCEVACPYHIPKFQWSGMNARIVKCELCKERVAKGEESACAATCPTHAVIFGRREALLTEAHRRIEAQPGKYYGDRVFGEQDGGGTQVLYLTEKPFEKLGLPKLEAESIPGKYLKWQKQAYSYLLFPAVLYVGMVKLIRHNWQHHEEEAEKDQRFSGMRSQL